MPIEWAVFGFFIGSSIGSFLNVAIYRLPLERSLVSPGSACPSCGHAIRPWHNVPVLGWLILGGKCADCRSPISGRYPLVETLMGVATAWLAWTLGPSAELLAWTVFAALLLVILWVDLDRYEILDLTTWPGVALGLAFAAYRSQLAGSWAPLIDSASAAVAGYAFFAMVSLSASAVFKRDGLGWGDVKFAAMLGAWLGWPLLPIALFLSSLVGSLVGVGLVVWRGRSERFPFGPSMVAGALLALAWGQSLWQWYAGWLL